MSICAGLAVAVLLAGCSDDTKVTKDQGVPDQPKVDAPIKSEGLKPDTPALKEPTIFATFNTGLATGSVPYAVERQPEIIKALKAAPPSDVLCLQEVWSDSDAQAFVDGLKAQYPYSFREKTEDTSTAQVRCANAGAVLALSTCRETKCTPKGLSTTACVTTECKPEYDALADDCKRCLAANVASPLVCLGPAKDYVYEGRNGLLLLSKIEIKNAKYTAMDTFLIKRGVINATVGSVAVQCTHPPADLGVVPYPTGGKYTNWETEHAGALAAITSSAPASGCVVLLGDLNCGPAQGSLAGEWATNFASLATAGYSEPWTAPQCTWCKDNPLAGSSDDRWIDHVMFKGCGTVSATYTRILDSEITIQATSGAVKTRLSDHYGVKTERK